LDLRVRARRSDRQHDLGQLRALQDWFLKYELKAFPTFAEVASIGGMVRQYQVVLDPERRAQLQASHIRASIDAIRKPTRRAGLRDRACRSRVHGARARLPAGLRIFRSIPLITTTPVSFVRLATSR
jgi:Cu(I)/Ag(I) efflux system membrane protein CusA/SilA